MYQQDLLYCIYNWAYSPSENILNHFLSAMSMNLFTFSILNIMNYKKHILK